jgi:predicted Zn-dependent protease with MMP-like domain
VKRERFAKLVTDVLDSLPFEFRDRIRSLAVLVEDQPPVPKRPHGAAKRPGRSMTRRLVLGIFEGVPATRKSVFDVCSGPNCIILYQRNIEAVCSNEAEIRREVRQTVLHELGHYFGMNESQLKDV